MEMSSITTETAEELGNDLPLVSDPLSRTDGVVYVDGAWFSPSEAKVSVFDHGLLYGDGVFEGIRFYNRRVFKLDAHVDRMYRSSRLIGLDPPVRPAAFRALILETCRRSRLEEGYVRPLFTRGVGDLGLDPRRARRPSVVIICSTMRTYEDREAKGIRAITSSVRKIPATSFTAHTKSLNYLTSVLAKAEANARGVDDAIQLDQMGDVAEASGENVFVVKKAVVSTPPTDSTLEGITRETVLEFLRLRYSCRIERVRPEDLLRASEVFLTGTGAGILPVVELDGESIGDGRPGPVTREVQHTYDRLIRTTGTPIPAAARGKLARPRRPSPP